MYTRARADVWLSGRRRSGMRGMVVGAVDRRGGGGGGGGGLLGVSELVLFHRIGGGTGMKSWRGAGKMSSSSDGFTGIKCRSSSSSGTVLATLCVSKARLLAE